MPRSTARQRRLLRNFVPMDGRSRGTFDPSSVASLGSTASSMAPPPTSQQFGSAFPTTGPTRIDKDILFLINRATNGFTVPAYQEALSMGYHGWLQWQLDHENIDDTAVDTALSAYPTLNLSNTELYENYINDPGAVALELQEALLVRAIYSRKQLFERMVEFWTDHFNISQLDDLALWWKTADDRDTIRAHALGSFPEMLQASSRSSCMMWYLDNYANIAGAAQENWARELMELHTLGVDGPYTGNDVREVARCFTGWTFHGVFTAGPVGQWTYVNAVHDQGSKVVLGQNIPANGGSADGQTVLNMLANHPKTAEFISTKMARHLLSYDPPQALIQRVTDVYMSTGGDIKSMVREILRPPSVAMVPEHKRPKLKRPYHLAVAMTRALQINSTNLLGITAEMQRMGQVPYWWPAPDGYPDELNAWGSALLPRWEFNSRITGLNLDGNRALIQTIADLMATAPASATTVGQKIDWILTGGGMRPVDVNAVDSFWDSQAGGALVLREAIALAASSPGYQYY